MALPSIAHVIPSLDVGGAEMMLVKLLEGMAPTRWRLSVVSLRGRGTLGDEIEALGVSLATVEMRGSVPTPMAAWRLRRTVRRLAPDLIQGWMYHGNLAATAGRYFGALRSPVVWNIRSDVFKFSSEKVLTAGVVRLCRALSSSADRIIYNSHASARGHAALGFATAGAVVIPNGFDTVRFAPSLAARAALRKRLGVSPEAVLIGRVGRYHPVKDFPGFLEAAGILARRGTGVEFVLAGPGVDQQNADLAALVERLGLTGAVHLLGDVRPPHELMAALDICCSSSAYGESFPNVLGEAMASGVPCVTTDLGDSAWVVGEAGLVIPPRDPSALAAACQTLMDAGLEGRRRVGAIGRERVVRDFSLERVAALYEDLYGELLERARRS